MNSISPSASILVVDDTVENLRLLVSMLDESGYEVRPVISGKQALQAAERDPPDLILLDINMPEMNGYEVCSRLKANPKLKDIPVIFLTALNEISDKVKAFGEGGIDYITKPFQIEEVQARVRTHVALRRAGLELARSYERLCSLEKLRDDLVHMVVHDMRSPLMVLCGHLALLEGQSGKELTDESRTDLRAAIVASQVLNRMANDLLDVSRIEEGKMPLDPTRVDVGAMAASVADGFSYVARSRAIRANVAGNVEAICDEDLIRRVIENLVTNGIKHTPASGAIRIDVEEREGKVRVAVVDQGPGVPAEARERIFDKYETASARRERTYHSVGLGLAFCRMAVEAHGGSIGVDSGETVGSVFWFELPTRT